MASGRKQRFGWRVAYQFGGRRREYVYRRTRFGAVRVFERVLAWDRSRRAAVSVWPGVEPLVFGPVLERQPLGDWEVVEERVPLPWVRPKPKKVKKAKKAVGLPGIYASGVTVSGSGGSGFASYVKGPATVASSGSGWTRLPSVTDAFVVDPDSVDDGPAKLWIDKDGRVTTDPEAGVREVDI